MSVKVSHGIVSQLCVVYVYVYVYDAMQCNGLGSGSGSVLLCFTLVIQNPMQRDT